MADDRAPPYDLEAEAAVLSSILLDENAIDEVADVVRPEHFYSESHRHIFAAALATRERSGAVDVVLVSATLKDNGRLAQIGGMAYMTEVLGAAPAVTNVRRYAQVILDKWRVRQAIQICRKHEALGYSEYGDATEYVQSLASDVHELACDETRATASTIQEIVIENIKAARDIAQRGAKISGLETGFDRYDRTTAGLHDGELTIVAARPGMGKTSLVLDIANYVASFKAPDDTRPYVVHMFSLEMPRAQIGNRMLCSEGRIDLGRMRTGMMSPTDWSNMTNAAARIAALALTVDDGAALSLVDVRAKSRRAQSEAKKRGRKLALVVVDYLQLMSAGKECGSREQEVSEISRGLKQLAKELGVPVIALSQLNRQCESRNDKRPQLSDLRESGAVEQDADNVVFIYRDDYYKRDSEERGIAELIIAKQRNGPTATVKVRFEAQYTRFDNLPDGEFDEESRYGT